MDQAQLQALLQGMAALQDQQRVQHHNAENARENRNMFRIIKWISETMAP